jgi:hypothetical protein
MSNTCKYFLHELGKSSSLKNAITPRNKYALQFSVKHYLVPIYHIVACQAFFKFQPKKNVFVCHRILHLADIFNVLSLNPAL